MKKKKILPCLVVKDPAQLKALASPIRLEIIGSFGGQHALSVTEMAQHMGRPVTALYYHVNHMVEIGLLIEAGNRPKGKRYEVLYLPAAQRFEVDPENHQKNGHADTINTVAVAQRMALRDLKAALGQQTTRFEGDQRNCLAFRLHTRINSETLSQVNHHLDAITELLTQQCSEPNVAGDKDQFCSLTVALMPLKGRKPKIEET